METSKDLTALAVHQINRLITAKVSENEFWCCVCAAGIPMGPDDARRRENSANLKCDGCRDAEKNAAEQQRLTEQKLRAGKLVDKIPKLFLSTAAARLPDPKRLDLALNWKFGPRGLLLYGPSGTGKSRCIWEVAKREIFAGRSFRAVNTFELMTYPSLLMESASRAMQFANELASPDILLLDDVFKAKPTERVEELIFSVLDQRAEQELPLLATLNDTGETLTTRLTADRGPAIIRRMRDYCQGLRFV